MLPIFDITDDDICYAERILLPQGANFDHERCEFIRNLSTIDLQAVPGSGKTTALLAKLLILETKLPFDNGSGILVLSHTNVAIDEIKEKIQQHCPKLFRYPNFIGTIQSFVNEFLAVPYYVLKMNRKPIRIDQDIYLEQLDFQLSNSAKIALINRLGSTYQNIMSNAFLDKRKIVDFWSDDEIKIPRLGSHTDTYKELIRVKTNLLKIGILSFNDCYALAKRYITYSSTIAYIINRRFNFAFIDEMQDMDIHQYELIEKIFFANGSSSSIIQRIGDKNQSIYNSVKFDCIWEDRPTVLRLSNSQRLSQPIANVVKNFALYRHENFDIVGLNVCQLKPHILLFTTASVKEVIPFFTQLVQQYKDSGELIIDKKLGQVKVICWNTDWKNDEKARKDEEKIRLEDFHELFNKNEQRSKEDYKCLKSYLCFYDRKLSSLAPIRKNILYALLKILRLERIHTNDSRYYTITSLMSFLKENHPLSYEELNLKIYQCSMNIIRGNLDNTLTGIKGYIHIFLSIFTSRSIISPACTTFINNDNTGIQSNAPNNINLQNNIIEDNGIKIEITNVHSVKGQTHSASLYLESYYYLDGKGTNAKSYESQRLANQFLGMPIGQTTERSMQSAKMAYVGFSRPTQLLCIAIHKDRFTQHLSTIDRSMWEIREIS